MAGKIIKGHDPSLQGPSDSSPTRIPLAPRRTGVVDSDEFEAHSRAREILAQAEAQAAELRQRTLDDRKVALADARERGRQEGMAQVGETLAKAQLEAGRKLQAAKADIIKLSMKVAERIIGRELDVREDTILQIVGQAVDQLRQDKELVLRVHPLDAEAIRTNKHRLMEKIGRLKDIAVREDPEIRRGGCVIETESGTVDAQLETQLELLERALLSEP